MKPEQRETLKATIEQSKCGHGCRFEAPGYLGRLEQIKALEALLLENSTLLREHGEMRNLLFQIVWAASRGDLAIEARGDSEMSLDIKALLARIPDRSEGK
jgi:hypothetical protein